MTTLKYENNSISIDRLQSNEHEIDLMINVISFSIITNFSLLIERFELTEFIDSIQQIYKTSCGKTELRQRAEDNYISLAGDNLGHIIVSGCFTDYKNKDNNCSFKFIADQSSLPEFIRGLKEINC